MASAGVLVAALTACAGPEPEGPSIAAAPARGKNYETFPQDDTFSRAGPAKAAAGALPGRSAQTRHDAVYARCMTGKGDAIAPPQSSMGRASSGSMIGTPSRIG